MAKAAIRNLDLLDWRLTTEHPHLYEQPVQATLDMASALAAEDHQQYFARQRCDYFHAMELLQFLVEQGLLSQSDAEYKQVFAYFKYRRPFLGTYDVRLRMQHARGSCPLCGYEPQWRSFENGRIHHIIGERCPHLRYDTLFNPEKDLGAATTWMGFGWPFGKKGQPLAHRNGEPLVERFLPSDHCQCCQTADLRRTTHRDLYEALVEIDTRYGESCVGLRKLRSVTSADCRHPDLDDAVERLLSESDTTFTLGGGLSLHSSGMKSDSSGTECIITLVAPDGTTDVVMSVSRILDSYGLRNMWWPAFTTIST